MSVLERSRWQFRIITVYHFIFVPLTIGLSILVACMQMAWLVKKNPVYLRMTKCFGALFLMFVTIFGYGGVGGRWPTWAVAL
jgi:cytochrome d ubiquinol oxidase subunit I